MTTLGIIGPWQILLLIFGLILPLIALIDVLRNNFRGNNKLVWLLVIIFFNLFGALLYFIIGRGQKIKK
ncbi:PLD nuclease N-terminal domain-containing protein [Aquimarina sp. 2201CG5-10]|uniref:PLD nuclease N-terminal domain-containing protein n=1 Tax=Aquimarina callyspongiae TaxID=3098150 RepID=UPI002AB401A7|nr:PLD nuclease N-terminal domain-containing protein [Aquimarina sp. 2201CG5-10]MDY8137259.1 PLD nuclease N-terminal domain-containing protein [Aquimarina sp. 2201CG5-10]